MALDPDRIRESIETGIQRLEHSLDEQIRSLVDDLWKATQDDKASAVEEVRAALAAREAEQARQAAAAKRATELEAEVATLREAAASEAGRLRDEHASEVGRLRKEHASEVGRLREEHASETARLREEHESATRELHARLDARDVELSQVRAELAAVSEQAAADLASASTGEPSAFRLARTVRRLDQSRSLSEVLDALGDGLRDEASRVAVVVIKTGGARIWRSSGFEPALGADPVALSTDASAPEPGVLIRAVRHGEASIDSSDPDGDALISGLPIDPLPPGHTTLAVPLLIGGRVAAVAYADDVGDGEDATRDEWPALVEVIARHAGRCLEALTAQRLPHARAQAAGAAGR